MKQDIDSFVNDVRSRLNIFKSDHFTFEEESHTYKYSNTHLDSVTTFLKSFKEPFLKDYWAGKKASELGVDKGIILMQWDEKARIAAELGTKVHKWIEDFYQKSNIQLPEEGEVLSRVNKFKSLHETRLFKMVPIAFEVKVFSRKWGLAGTIDALFAFYDEKMDRILLVMGDWKTNADFKTDTHQKGRYKKMLRPFNDLYENNISEYSIQLSLYRLILEQCGIVCDSAFLCHIGPQSEAKIYPALDLRERLFVFLEQNRNRDIFSIE